MDTRPADDEERVSDSGPVDDRHHREQDRLPLFPLSSPLFPGMSLPLHIFEERYRTMLGEREDVDPVFGIVLTRSGREVGDQPAIHDIGTAATLLGVRMYDDGRADIAVRGTRRFRVIQTDWSGPYLVADVEWLPDETADDGSLTALADRTRSAMLRLVAVAAHAGNLPVPDLRLPGGPTDLGFLLSRTLWLNTWERQELLELPTTRARLERLAVIIHRERRMLTVAGASGTPIDHPGSRFLPN
jgi:Lon protease-like protein